MKQKGLPIFVVLAVGFILAACGSTSQASSSAAQTTPGPRGFDPSKMTLQDKLAIGTLKLEGTKLAVDSKEAATLLPLWGGVQSLGTSNTTSQEEMDALYSQIKDSMTADQVKAIDDMKFTRDDINKIMADLGIDFGPNQGGTRTPGTNRPSGNGNAPSGPGGPGNFPGGGDFRPGGDTGGGFAPRSGNSGAQSTPSGTRPSVRRGLSWIFIRPLINLLKQRAGS
jgi:hypothetical protein